MTNIRTSTVAGSTPLWKNGEMSVGNGGSDGGIGGPQ